MRDFKAVGNHVFVKVFESEQVTESGIYLIKDPDQWKPCEGEVCSVGRGLLVENEKTGKIYFHPMTVKEGDCVLFGKYAGFDVEVNGMIYKVLHEEDIIATLDYDAELEEEDDENE